MSRDRTMRRAHLWVGGVTLSLFAASGGYLAWHFPELYEEQEALRYLYRSNHLYLLGAGLVNSMAGIYFRFSPVSWRRKVQRLGSGLVILSPFLLALAFVVEAGDVDSNRVWTHLGLETLLVGSLLHLAGVASSTSEVPSVELGAIGGFDDAR